jgi:5'-nucleotidase (lipoprotein e(P4) family)
MKKTLRTGKIFTVNFLIVVSLFSCNTTKDVAAPTTGDPTYQLSQQNVDAALWTATSAEMHYASIQAYDLALLKLRTKISKDYSKPMAVVMDLDETVLDNSPYMFSQIAKGKTFDGDSWYEWCMEASAGLLPGAFDFIKKCNTLDIEVFYISNRGIETLSGTLDNLQMLDIKTDAAHVLLKESMSDKSDRRSQVSETNDIILYIGDNLRDFSEIYKDRESSFGKYIVDEDLSNLRENFIIIPNPMYGEWRKPINMGQKPSTDSEKAALIENFIKSRN